VVCHELPIGLLEVLVCLLVKCSACSDHRAEALLSKEPDLKVNHRLLVFANLQAAKHFRVGSLAKKDVFSSLVFADDRHLFPI
jgi:hypothetical protein